MRKLFLSTLFAVSLKCSAQTNTNSLPLNFLNVTNIATFQSASLILSNYQFDAIVQMIQASGIAPSVPVTSSNTIAILMFRNNSDTNTFNLSIRLTP
jgi:hypothetical protein